MRSCCGLPGRIKAPALVFLEGTSFWKVIWKGKCIAKETEAEQCPYWCYVQTLKWLWYRWEYRNWGYSAILGVRMKKLESQSGLFWGLPCCSIPFVLSAPRCVSPCAPGLSPRSPLCNPGLEMVQPSNSWGTHFLVIYLFKISVYRVTSLNSLDFDSGRLGTYTLENCECRHCFPLHPEFNRAVR